MSAIHTHSSAGAELGSYMECNQTEYKANDTWGSGGMPQENFDKLEL